MCVCMTAYACVLCVSVCVHATRQKAITFSVVFYPDPGLCVCSMCVYVYSMCVCVCVCVYKCVCIYVCVLVSECIVRVIDKQI